MTPERKRPTTADVDAVVKACLRNLVLDEIAPSPKRYAHLPLCVLDAVLTPRARYEGVIRSVERYASLAGLADRAYCSAGETIDPADQHRLSDFIETGRSRGSEVLATEIGHRGVTAKTRRTEVALRLAEALRALGIETLQDFQSAWDERPDELVSTITSVQGVGDVTGHYLLMLAGNEDGVKPDVMIRRFVTDAVGRAVSANEAQELVRSAARELVTRYPSLTPRSLDGSIWRYQRSSRRRGRA